jgi:hypothetical protein
MSEGVSIAPNGGKMVFDGVTLQTGDLERGECSALIWRSRDVPKFQAESWLKWRFMALPEVLFPEVCVGSSIFAPCFCPWVWFCRETGWTIPNCFCPEKHPLHASVEAVDRLRAQLS